MTIWKRKITVNFNFNWLFQWQILYTETTNLLRFTRNVPKPHCQRQCTLKLFSENRVLFVWVDLHVSLRRQWHMQFVSYSFFLIRSSFNLTNIPNASEKRGRRTVRSRFKTFYLGNHSEVDTYSYELFFSQLLMVYLPKYWLFILHHPV
jgi:hypothetical protein